MTGNELRNGCIGGEGRCKMTGGKWKPPREGRGVFLHVCQAHLSFSRSSAELSVKTWRGKRWWKDLARWGANTRVKPGKDTGRGRIERLLGSGEAGPTYRTLYTPQAAPCTWRDTVDKSIPPETDLDRWGRPGAWETQQQQQQPHVRKRVGCQKQPLLTCPYSRHAEGRFGILVCDRGCGVLRKPWAHTQTTRLWVKAGAELSQPKLWNFSLNSTVVWSFSCSPIRIKEHSDEELAGGGLTCSISSSLKWLSSRMTWYEPPVSLVNTVHTLTSADRPMTDTLTFRDFSV